MKAKNKEREILEDFEHIRETMTEEDTIEKEREMYYLLANIPVISVWKEKARKYDLVVRKRNEILKRYRGSHLVGLEQQFEMPMTKHHVSERDVVYVPTYIHASIRHRLGDGKLEGVVG